MEQDGHESWIERLRARRFRAGALLAGAGALAVVAVLAVGGVLLLVRSGAAAASPTPSSSAIPFGATFVVWPDAKSHDDERCVQPTMTYGRSQPDYGEEYVGEGGLVINFTGRLEAHIADLRSILPEDCRVLVRKVTLGSVEGRALQRRIETETGMLTAAGVDVTSIGYDPIRDRVEVGVYTLTPYVRAELERRYGKDRIDVAQERPEPA